MYGSAPYEMKRKANETYRITMLKNYSCDTIGLPAASVCPTSMYMVYEVTKRNRLWDNVGEFSYFLMKT